MTPMLPTIRIQVINFMQLDLQTHSEFFVHFLVLRLFIKADLIFAFEAPSSTENSDSSLRILLLDQST